MLSKKILDESIGKSSKIWVDKGSQFYNSPIKPWLQDDNREMYSIKKEGKSFVAKRFIRTLGNKIYEYMTSISKNVYTDKLDVIVNKYNISYHRTVKMKPVDIKPSIYTDFNKENYKEGVKFKVDDNFGIS